MNYLQKLLRKQRKYLYEILENKPDAKQSAKMAQSLRVDDSVIGQRGNITIVQNQSMQIVINNVSKALQISDQMLLDYDVPTGFNLKQCLFELFNSGLTWKQIKESVARELFKIALENSESQAQAARRLGVNPRLIRYQKDIGRLEDQ